MLNQATRISHVEEILSTYAKVLSDKSIANVLELTSFSTLEDLMTYERKGGFGLDCGWAKVEFVGEFGDKVGKMYNRAYGYYDNCIRVYCPISTQSTTVQALALQPLVEYLTEIGFPCAIEITLD